MRNLRNRLNKLERMANNDGGQGPLAIRLTDIDQDGRCIKPWEDDPELEAAYQRRDAIRRSNWTSRRAFGGPVSIDYFEAMKDATYRWLAELSIKEPRFQAVAERYCSSEDWHDGQSTAAQVGS